MISKLLTAQEVYKNISSRFAAGFNRRVYGESYVDAFSCDNERFDIDMNSGWRCASKLIDEGKIPFVYNFHKFECEDGCAFQYGGFWVCNECGKKSVDKDWWTIIAYKDGDMWFCRGMNFINLQESNNYAFGKTRQEAIDNYGKLMYNHHDIIQSMSMDTGKF